MKNRPARIISNTIYGIGVAITIILGDVALFGSNQVIDPDAMIPITPREQAFIWLAFGAIPMLLTCIAVYRFNSVKNSSHKIRDFILIFFPGFICAACTLFILGLLIVGMVNSFQLH